MVDNRHLPKQYQCTDSVCISSEIVFIVILYNFSVVIVGSLTKKHVVKI